MKMRIADWLQRTLGMAQIDARLAGLDQRISSLRDLQKEPAPPAELEAEIDACRAISNRSVFIVGPARSSTTVLSQVLNLSPEILVTGEANFYLPHKSANFRERLNRQYLNSGNQVSKSSYIPNFVPGEKLLWWQWYAAASQKYRLVGDKMALAAGNYRLRSPDDIRAFFELRFFEARYIFTFRDPLQTMTSMAKLFHIDGEARMAREIDGWLQTVQLWADWTRTLPNTITLTTQDMTPEVSGRLSQFLGVTLPPCDRFVRQDWMHQHEPQSPLLLEMAALLTEIYRQIDESEHGDPQARGGDRVRTLGRDHFADRTPPFPMPAATVWQVWALAERGRRQVADRL